LRKGKKKQPEQLPSATINQAIRAKELRVLDDEGNNYGIMTRADALAKAKELGTDLIEISPNAVPPVAKIMDYGKFQYDQKKKIKAQKAKAHNVEVKSIQVKIGTDGNDLAIKAKRASDWLEEGHRVKIELFLPGRSRFLEEAFLKERLDRVLRLVTVEYAVADEAKKVPKGLATIIERSKK
jgi:translation initiation factor IF-3